MKVAIIMTIFLVGAFALPTNFDARTQWPGCVNTILDQEQCGSCWDFCSVESFANRMCITGEASGSTIISPEPILECSRYGCGGGYPKTAWNYLITTGGTTCTNLCKGGCAPYDSGAGTSPACHAGKCDSGAAQPVTYYAGSFQTIARNVNQIQTELYNNGPLQACFTVYNNFYTYFSLHPKGIYTASSGSNLGGHCVKLVGWGVDSGQDYWLFANSWGTSWGDAGFFRMARGTNLCGIENQVTEGFTKKQTIAHGIAMGTINVTNEIMTGGWTNQEAVEDFEAEIIAALDLAIPEKIVDHVVRSVETQVVAGINYRVQSVATLEDGEKVKVVSQIHRNLAGEISLMSKHVTPL